MAELGQAAGYGNNSTAQNVFAFYTDQALSAPIKYYAYDGGTFPTTGSAETTTNTILAGTAGNSNISMICLVDTTNAAPSSAWKPASPTGGEANPNRLKGTTNYVEQDGSNLTAASRATFNMVIEIPSDVTTASTMTFDLTVEYSYTGTAPSPEFQFNNEDPGTGTEGTPDWDSITQDTYGIKHTRAGVTYPDLYANIPESGTEDTAEGHATD